MTNITLLQVNVGWPALLLPHHDCRYARDRKVFSSLVKQRVEDPYVAVGFQGIDGDKQEDTRLKPNGERVHGGVFKAVYALPLEHLAEWDKELSDGVSPGISFGENLTILGATEVDVRVGDVYSCGDVVLRATEPRRPCYKLGRHLGDGVPLRMNETGRCGWYFSVLKPGSMSTGADVLTLEYSEPGAPTIAEVFASKIRQNPAIPGLPDEQK